ncbi:hypothetical protein [Catenulispora subtropica]|uniref:hypothetical protein n=1 Tax=Catenulispora subtropica TaxID=450798 RepID=UPI0031D512C3
MNAPTFARFSIVGVPFGYGDADEDPALGDAATGQAETWQQTLSADWASQGATVGTGPVANLFGQQVAGTLIQPTIPADGITPRQVDMVQWVVEAGGRLWIVKDMQDHTADTAAFATDLTVTSPNVDVATSIGTGAGTGAVTSPNQTYAVGNAMSMAVSGNGTTSGETSSLPALPRPSWWKGSGPCDSGNSTSKYPNFALHNSHGVVPSFRGLVACGPTRSDRANVHDGEPTVSIGGFGEYEWECVELSQRYLYLAGYTSGGYGSMGNTVVDHYPGTKMKKIANNAVAGVVPVAGDVVSMNHSNYAGHTAVVIGSNVDSSGNGVITVLQNNWDDTGVGTMKVTGWKVHSENDWGGTDVNWLHDPNNTGTSGPPPATPGVTLGGVTDGQQNVTGTVTLTANPSMAVDGVYYHIVNQSTGYDTVSPEIFGGAPYSYSVNTLNLPNGTYRAYATAPLSGHPTGISRQSAFTVNNNPIPAPPQLTVPSGRSFGTVDLSATSSGATQITYFVDGANIGNSPSGGTLNWNTVNVTDGPHAITAVARNGAGSSTLSTAKSVIIDNNRSHSSSPAAAQSNGTVDVLFAGADGTPNHTFFLPGGQWTVPASMGPAGSGMASQVSTVTSSAGVVDAFWKGVDGNLWHVFYYPPTASWSQPQIIPGMGTLGGAPFAVADTTGRIDVFWKGADAVAHLWHTSYDGNWASSPDDLTPNVDATSDLASDPAPVVTAPGTVDVFWKGGNGTLWHVFDLAGRPWASPNAIPNMGTLGGAPKAVGQIDGTVDVFWKGGDAIAHLWHAAYHGSWSTQPDDLTPSADAAGDLGSDPVPVSSAPGTVDVFWQGGNGTLWHVFDLAGNPWANPTAIPNIGTIGGTPFAAAQPNGTIDVFWKATGSTPGMWHTWWNPGGTWGSVPAQSLGGAMATNF